MTVSLPPLPYDTWKPTMTTLHIWTQIVGKVALRSSARRSHWWNLTLKPTARGLTTERLRANDMSFTIAFDFIDHRLDVVADCPARRASFALHDGLSVADFRAALDTALAELGIVVRIVERPYGMGVTTPFRDDQEHHRYDAAMVRRWFEILGWTTDTFQQFAEGFVGKQGPVQLFWHTFDLALGRYSGRRASGPPSADPVEREAYSHEVIAFGFWPGDPNTPAPTYYTYTAPEPPTLIAQPLAPTGAAWHPSGSGHIGTIGYDAIRAASDPAAALTTFLESGYRAGVVAAAWDVECLDRR